MESKNISDFIKYNLNKAMYVHAIDNNHTFNFNNAKVIVNSNDFHYRKVIESSFINSNRHSVVNISPGLNSINNLSNLTVHSYGARFLDPNDSWTYIYIYIYAYIYIYIYAFLCLFSVILSI